jgi:hypothetical protein
MSEIVANNLAMRKNFTLLAVLFMCKSGIAQISSGDRIAKTYFDLGFTTQTSQVTSMPSSAKSTYRTGSVMLGASFGKLTNSNTAVLYGAGIGFASGKSLHGSGSEGTSTTIGISPSVTLQKFYQVTPGIYYMPDASLAFTYERGKDKSSSVANSEQTTNTVRVRGGITPFSVGVNLKKSMMLTFNAGRLGIEYGHRKSGYEGSIHDRKTTFFNVQANSSSWAVGLLFNLGKKS